MKPQTKLGVSVYSKGKIHIVAESIRDDRESVDYLFYDRGKWNQDTMYGGELVEEARAMHEQLQVA